MIIKSTLNSIAKNLRYTFIQSLSEKTVYA